MDQPIELYQQLKNYIANIRTEFELGQAGGVYFSFANTGIRGGKKWFNIGLVEILDTLEDINTNISIFSPAARYEEKTWRDLGGQYFTNEIASSLITVQTKPLFTTLSKIIDWANDKKASAYRDGLMDLEPDAIQNAINKIKSMVGALSPEQMIKIPSEGEIAPAIPLPHIDLAFQEALVKTGFSN